MPRRPGIGYGELQKGDTTKVAGGGGLLPEQITQGFGPWGEPGSIILDGFFAVGGQFPEIITQGFGVWGTAASVICDGLFHRGFPPSGPGAATSWVVGAELFDDDTQGLWF